MQLKVILVSVPIVLIINVYINLALELYNN